MSCPPIMPVSSNIGDNLNQENSLLNGLNINNCQESSAKNSSSYSNSGSTALFFQKSASSGSESASSQSSVGCGSLNLLMQNHMNAVNDVHCILQEQNQMVSTTVENINSIEFFGNVTLNCSGNFNISQHDTVNMTVVNHIGATAQAKIKESVQNAIQKFGNDLKNLGAGDTAYGPNGEGTTLINLINSETVQNNAADAISDCIQQLTTVTINGNTLQIGETGGTITINAGKDCDISQDTHVSMVANSIVDSAFYSALSDVNLNKLMPPLPPPPPSSSSSLLYWIIGIVAVILLLGVAGYFYFRKSKLPTKLPTKPQIQPQIQPPSKFRF